MMSVSRAEQLDLLRRLTKIAIAPSSIGNRQGQQMPTPTIPTIGNPTGTPLLQASTIGSSNGMQGVNAASQATTFKMNNDLMMMPRPGTGFKESLVNRAKVGRPTGSPADRFNKVASLRLKNVNGVWQLEKQAFAPLAIAGGWLARTLAPRALPYLGRMATWAGTNIPRAASWAWGGLRNAGNWIGSKLGLTTRVAPAARDTAMLARPLAAGEELASVGTKVVAPVANNFATRAGQWMTGQGQIAAQAPTGGRIANWVGSLPGKSVKWGTRGAGVGYVASHFSPDSANMAALDPRRMAMAGRGLQVGATFGLSGMPELAQSAAALRLGKASVANTLGMQAAPKVTAAQLRQQLADSGQLAQYAQAPQY